MHYQEILTLAIVAAAAVYLGRVAYRTLFAGKSGCGNCPGESATGAPTVTPLVQLDIKPKKN